ALEEPLATTADTLRQAWQTWADGPPEPVGLAAHLEGHFDAVDVALADLRSAVTAELDRHDAAWRAVAGTLAGYAAQAKKCGGLAPRRNAARAALTWLKQEDNHLKNQRLRPIADEAKAIWAALRQESNVDIAGITLEGTSTRRHVEIAASIDGTDAPGVTVLSQGELHALALALFLPRATMPSSPFRFIVLDDPVQAMDPAKVDGLLDVLTQLARNRQVVVFSHDDRLATAARHASSDATIVKVTREEGSRVHVSGESDPAQRYLMDAWALIKDEGIDEPTTRRILPGILRLAVEAAARDRFFTHLYATGTSRADVEQAWESARKTSAKVALTVYGEARHDLTPWLNKRSYRRRALGICTSGMHHGAAGDLVSAHRDVKDLVADIARTS
ncbi:MAG: recombinase RecF, partial [Micrococcales bacterium]